MRSVGAVLSGILAIVILSVATDTIMEATGVFPPVTEQQENGFKTPWMVALALTYRTLFYVVGGYVTAAVAKTSPIRHAMVLGAIGIVLGIGGAVAMWDFAPAWYTLGLVVTALPAIWLGATLRPAKAVLPATA